MVSYRPLLADILRYDFKATEDDIVRTIDNNADIISDTSI